MTNVETIKKIEAELFTPALQNAVQQARESGCNKEEALLAVANAYLNMLVPFLGSRERALTFLKDQVDFLESQV